MNIPYDKIINNLLLLWETISTLIMLLLEFNKKKALDVIISHFVRRTFKPVSEVTADLVHSPDQSLVLQRKLIFSKKKTISQA